VADSSRATGIGFWGALTLLFIAFKITGYIDWSWIWVLAPLWGPIALMLVVAFVVILVTLALDWDGQ